MAQLEEAWTVNHAVDGLSPSWVKLTKSLQQTSNPKIAVSFGSRPKFVSTLNIHLCPLPNGQVLRLPGVVSSDMLRFESLWIALTVPEVVDTENWVTSL